jgi:parallel beta-helix repeat protein
MKATILYALALLLLAPMSAPEAVAQAQPVACGTVIDRPGKYELSGDLSCPLGFPPPLFCDAAAITITAPHVELNGRGFSVSGIRTGVGIRITSTDVRVLDIVVAEFNVGIEITGGGLHHLHELTVRGNSAFHCGDGIGLQLTNTNDNRLSGSVVSGNEHWGIRLVSSSNNRLHGNEITNNQFRPGREAGNIDLVSSDENSISDNDLSGGGLVGVFLNESSRNRIDRNVVTDTAPNTEFGTAIVLIHSVENAVRANSVSRSLPDPFSAHTGIHLGEGARRNVVRDNQVFGHSDNGIELAAGATENEVRGNHALENTPFDAADENAGCDGNTWKGNQFGTVNQPVCIE